MILTQSNKLLKTKGGLFKILIYLALVVLIGNINAIVDYFLHPEIPYFDEEHIIVGSSTAMFSLVLGALLLNYINRLHRINIENANLLEELSLAKEKAEDSSRLKSAFLANMSHEIRTPMNSILGFTDVLRNEEISKEEQQVFLNVIYNGGNRLLDLINDIIDISKIESGTVELNISEIDIQDLFKNVHAFFLLETQNKGLELICEPPKNGKTAIQSDKVKLHSILSNLIKNAIKYTIDGSIIVSYKIDDEKLSVRVKDTGIGIPKESLNSIFERFVREDNKGKKGYEGAGLGLAISSAYVEMLKGKIWAESSPKGSSFYFEIPV